MPGRAPPKNFAAENRPSPAVGIAPNGLLLGAVCVLLAILISACSPSGLNSISFADGQRWSASFSLLQNASNLAVDLSALESSLRVQGIQSLSSPLARTGQNGSIQLQLSGSGGSTQLRGLLFGQ